MTTTRTTGGRFAPGASGNTRGRPTNEQRVRREIERTLQEAGATPEDIDRLARVAGDKMKSALVIALLAAAVAERREQVTPSPVDSPVHT